MKLKKARKQQKDIAAILRDILFCKISVRRGDRVRRVPKIEAALEAAMEKALQGDHVALHSLVAHARTMDVLRPEQSSNAHRVDDSVLAFLLDQTDGIRERLRAGRPDQKSLWLDDPPIGA